jgi:hypothetical protein
MLKKIQSLPLDFDKILKVSYPENSSCVTHQKHELKDIHQKFGGFPQSYTMGNTSIRQYWWKEDEIDFNELGSLLDMEVVTVSSILQPPGNVIPWHRDTFYQIKKRFPDDKRQTVRANIYLEDWKIGHFIQYQDTVDTHWKAGDGFIWDSEVLHLGANAGMEDKYTLQVSGFNRGQV